jgi:hypothetical protein
MRRAGGARREGSSESEAQREALRLMGSGREAGALRRLYADYASALKLCVNGGEPPLEVVPNALCPYYIRSIF